MEWPEFPALHRPTERHRRLAWRIEYCLAWQHARTDGRFYGGRAARHRRRAPLVCRSCVYARRASHHGRDSKHLTCVEQPLPLCRRVHGRAHRYRGAGRIRAPARRLARTQRLLDVEKASTKPAPTRGLTFLSRAYRLSQYLTYLVIYSIML